LAHSEIRRMRAAEPARRINGRNWTKADVLLHDLDGARVALKDYGGRPLVVRHTVGRWLVRREVRAYEAAAGVDGIPRFHGRAGAFALVTEWVDARPLADLEPGDAPRGWAERLAAIVDALHARGVALGDLHSRDVLIDAAGRVHVVDLATALAVGTRPGPLRRWLFERLSDQDRVAVARMRARHAGEDELAAIAAVGERAARWYRRGRFLRHWLDRLRGRADPRPR
jgi:hypothetical protein